MFSFVIYDQYLAISFLVASELIYVEEVKRPTKVVDLYGEGELKGSWPRV